MVFKARKPYQKKKLLKLIINCHNPGIKRPITQLVIDFYDNDKQVFSIKILKRVL